VDVESVVDETVEPDARVAHGDVVADGCEVAGRDHAHHVDVVACVLEVLLEFTHVPDRDALRLVVLVVPERVRFGDGGVALPS